MGNDINLNYEQNENIFRTLVEESPTPVGLYVGREMVIKLANNSMLKTWGKGVEVIDKTYYEALPELEGQPIFEILNNVYNTGVAYEATEDRVDLVVDDKLQTFYFTFTFKPLKDKEGKVWGVINTAADVTELVLTRQKLTASEERTRFAMEAAELGTWDLNPITRIVECDKRCRELFRLKRGDYIAYDDVINGIHPDDVNYVNAQVMLAIDPENNKPYNIKYRTIGIEDKQFRWVRAHGKAYFDDKGNCTRFAGTVQDITREVNANKRHQKLAVLVENSADIISVGDLDANVTYINKAGYQTLGLEENKDIVGPGKEYFTAKDQAIINEQLIPSVMQTGKWSGELNYRHLKTNEPIPVHFNAFRIDDPETGNPLGLASVARDLRAEKAALNEQHKLLSLIDNTSDFISLSDLDGNVSYVNAAGREMVGLDNPEDVKRHNREYLFPHQSTDLLKKVKQALNKNGRWSGEVNYRHFKTGESIPVYGTSMLVYDPVNGEPLGRATIARDLRNEIAAKKALTESEHLLQNITKATPTALWMADDHGNIIYVNQTWVDWTGYSFEDSLGSGWTKAILTEDRQCAFDKFLSDLNSRLPYEINFRLQRKDGSIRWCIATGNPQHRSDGTFAGYIGACTDVTDKNTAEQQLQAKNEELNEQIKQFEFVTNFMPVQLWTATIEGELDYVNQRTTDFFGTTAENIIGPVWQSLIHPDDFENCRANWTHSLQTGDLYQVEFRLKDKDGNYKWHLSRALPFITDGKIVKWFGTNTDIDEQKQLQRQKDEFLGIASHELKTPVTSIKAYGQVLRAMLLKDGEQKKADMVLRMDAQINRLTNLIGDLLDVTKINSGKLQFNKTWFDFNQAIKDTVEDLQHTTNKHRLVESFKETGKIYTDKDRIGQVITNLITNAIKYSPHTDEIIISTERENNQITVCVQDFGIGIPGDKKDRVFEQFYRVSGDKQHTFPGLGLGLYISSEIIKREGGKMWVNSVEGKGSTFCFSLPVDYPIENQ